MESTNTLQTRPDRHSSCQGSQPVRGARIHTCHDGPGTDGLEITTIELPEACYIYHIPHQSPVDMIKFHFLKFSLQRLDLARTQGCPKSKKMQPFQTPCNV